MPPFMSEVPGPLSVVASSQRQVWKASFGLVDRVVVAAEITWVGAVGRWRMLRRARAGRVEAGSIGR